MIESPLNYTGGKYKLLDQILPIFPKDINRFVDLFCGGCNVGINIEAKEILFNDNNELLINLFKVFKKNSAVKSIKNINRIIKEYNLSDVSKYGYEHYKCESAGGLVKYNNNKFLKLRTDFNKRKKKDETYYYMFYVLIIYAFNNQIRFNSNGEFNLPVGKRDFNKCMKEKFITFIEKLSNINSSFQSKDFSSVLKLDLNNDDFVYADPPYLITCASYNEKNGWTVKHEIKLLKVLDELNKNNVRFALSNVLQNKGKVNKILIDWLNKNKQYHVFHLDNDYTNSNYHSKNKNAKTDEVLITNYGEK